MEIKKALRSRDRKTLVDTISVALTYADNIAVESGILEETGLLQELSEGVCGALPFVVIAAQEGSRIILGRKSAKTAAQDTAWRMLKTGAAMGIGCAVASVGGGLALTVGAATISRLMMDKIKSRVMVNVRVKSRTGRLHTLREEIHDRQTEPEAEAPVAVSDALGVEGAVY